MKSIVRRDTGEDWQEYVRRLMQEAGQIDPDDEPSAEELARFDRKRKDKKVSNQEWQSETDPDSRITKMKDGRTHLAYKAEHAVDLAPSQSTNRSLWPLEITKQRLLQRAARDEPPICAPRTNRHLSLKVKPDLVSAGSIWRAFHPHLGVQLRVTRAAPNFVVLPAHVRCQNHAGVKHFV